jgi:hypothetical protein
MKGGSMSLIIFGKVVCKETGEGIPNLRVKAVDKDLFFDDLLGAVETDSDGNFKISYDKEDFQELFLDKRPDIFIKIKDVTGRIIYTSESVRYNADESEEFKISIPKNQLNKEDVVMSSEDVQKVVEIMKKFDPALVSAAVQEISVKDKEVQRVKEGIKEVYDSIDLEPEQKLSTFKKAQTVIESEIVKEEVSRVKSMLLDFDKSTVREAASVFLGDKIFAHCDTAICICPEGDCRLRVGLFDQFDPSIYENLGLTYAKALKELEINRESSVVLQSGGKLGLLGKCFDSVNCMGSQIWVMHTCMGSLYALDINKGDLVQSILKISKENPMLHKRINKMLDKMKEAGEL